MKRRSFFSLLAGAAGIPLLPKTPIPKPEVKPSPVWNPLDHMGEWSWQNIPQPTAQLSNEVLDRIYTRLCETGTSLT